MRLGEEISPDGRDAVNLLEVSLFRSMHVEDIVMAVDWQMRLRVLSSVLCSSCDTGWGCDSC